MPSETTPGGVASDHDLMRAIAAGDTASLGALYDRHSPMVLSLCLRVLGSRAEAEEALGDVFWQVWEQAARFDPSRGNPMAWLLTLAKSRALDRLRALGRRRRVLVETDDPGNETAGLDRDRSGASPYEDLVVTRQRERVRAALARLDESQRRAVEMSFFEGLTHSEIAEALGEPLGTIKTRIRQGLIRLKDSLRIEYGGGAAL